MISSVIVAKTQISRVRISTLFSQDSRPTQYESERLSKMRLKSKFCHILQLAVHIRQKSDVDGAADINNVSSSITRKLCAPKYAVENMESFISPGPGHCAIQP